MTHLDCTKRVARLTHRCFICCSVIQPKTEYIDWRGVFDGVAVTAHYHIECCDELVSLDIYEFDEGVLLDCDDVSKEWLAFHATQEREPEEFKRKCRSCYGVPSSDR